MSEADFRKLLKTTGKFTTILAEQGIHNVDDLLYYFPRSYEDRSQIKTLQQLDMEQSTPQTVKGKVIKKSMITTPRGKKLVEIHFIDEDKKKGYIQALNSTFILRSTKNNQRYYIIGRPKYDHGKVQFRYPEMIEAHETDQEADNFNFGRIYPIYSELQGIKPHWFAKKIYGILDFALENVADTFPEPLRKEYKLLDKKTTLRALHFPESLQQVEQAKYRIFFERLLKIQLISQVNKRVYQSDTKSDEKQINQKTEKILGTAITIHKKYGNTLTEKQYQKLLTTKLKKEGFSIEFSKSIQITDDGVKVGTREMDIVVDNQIVIELKVLPFIQKRNYTQLRSYLKLGDYPIGLLLNFGSTKLGIQRLEKNYADNKLHSSDSSDDSSDLSLPDWECIKQFTETLPFELTNAQKRSLKDMVEDLYLGKPMMRLLQGDVGSGKTVVATALARYIIQKFKGQIAFLVPISVLAHQHYKTLAKLLLPLGIKIELLTGATKPADKKRIKERLAQGHIDIIVGTHAIIQEDIAFHDLQLAIIDEQHKFGVRQRAFFQAHGSPHLLQMTATPIPRSLALAYFGEFDVSIIDEMPVGRKPIQTKIITHSERAKLKPWILTKIEKGQQVFVITPLIDESEALDEVKAATTHWHELLEHYPELSGKIGLLHGRMSSAEKEQVMLDFKNKKLMMLVSTTVIEVGIDIPDATAMVILNAERFGLSQLHQLRGRVGRSDIKSYCFLETARKSGDTYKRLKHMEDTNDGFKLAEIDLRLRGTGEILGIRQSGETDLPLSMLTDVNFIQLVQQAAEDIMENHHEMVKDILGDELHDKMDALLV